MDISIYICRTHFYLRSCSLRVRFSCFRNPSGVQAGVKDRHVQVSDSGQPRRAWLTWKGMQGGGRGRSAGVTGAHTHYLHALNLIQVNKTDVIELVCMYVSFWCMCVYVCVCVCVRNIQEVTLRNTRPHVCFIKTYEDDVMY